MEDENRNNSLISLEKADQQNLQKEDVEANFKKPEIAEPKKIGSEKAIVIVAIALLILISIGLIAYLYLFQRNQSQEQAPVQTPASSSSITEAKEGKLVKESLDTLYSLDCNYETKKCNLFYKSTSVGEFTLPERLFSAYLYIPKNILAIGTYEEVVGEDPINLYVVKLNGDRSPIKIYSGHKGGLEGTSPSPTEITDIQFSPSGDYLILNERDWELTASVLVSLTENKELEDKRKIPLPLSPDWSPNEKHFVTYLMSAMWGYSIEYGTITPDGFETLEIGPFPSELKDADWETDTLNTYWNTEDGGIIEFKKAESGLTKYYSFKNNSKILGILEGKPNLALLTLSPDVKQEKILQYKVEF